MKKLSYLVCMILGLSLTLFACDNAASEKPESVAEKYKNHALPPVTPLDKDEVINESQPTEETVEEQQQPKQKSPSKHHEVKKDEGENLKIPQPNDGSFVLTKGS